MKPLEWEIYFALLQNFMVSLSAKGVSRVCEKLKSGGKITKEMARLRGKVDQMYLSFELLYLESGLAYYQH
jgi:hypothetical protein